MLPPVTFPTLGWQVVDWIEAYLCHGPGDIKGSPLEIDDEIALFICWMYRVHPQEVPQAGRRLTIRSVFSRPKGRAKSEIAGAIVCAEALGPVRCDGFDANGEPVGVAVKDPFIRCLATEEGQAGNTYDNVYTMLTEGEAYNAYAVDVGLGRTFIREPSGGEITPSSSGSASKDGGKESFYVADETHLYISKELRSMYRTVARNTGKRKAAEPHGLDTTTAWEPGEHSVAERAASRYAKLDVEEAVTKRGVLYDHRQGDIPKRFGDDRSLIKALRPGYGPAADWMDFQRIVQIIRDAEDPEGEAYRFWLNRPRKSASHWLAPEEILAVLEDFTVPQGAGRARIPIAAGFDGSENNDHTTLWGCLESGDLFPIGIWTPSGEDLSWRDEVNDAVAWMFKTFRVVRFEGDPPYWQSEMGQWSKDHGLKIVAEFWTNQDTAMAVATGALRTTIRQKACLIATTPLRTPAKFVVNDVVRDGGDGMPLVQWHFENARTRKVKIKLDDHAEEAYVVRKDRPGSDLKIDSVPAAVLARHARDVAVKLGLFKRKPNRRASWGGL